MIRLRLRRRDLVCQQAVELVTDYLEGGLSRADRRRYEAHLAGCPHCTEYLAQMRKTIELTGTLTPDDLTPQMQDEFVTLFRQWRAESADPGDHPRPGNGTPEP
jgi:anti-sigma factor RsiW